MRGYWNAPELTAAAFDDEGWLVSGDLGYLREDGNLAIVGRATDMYIRGGYNIYPAEVEAVLALHPNGGVGERSRRARAPDRRDRRRVRCPGGPSKAANTRGVARDSADRAF